jgi:hypothetical protein
MKNIMVVGSALMLLSTSAFASKARLQSLGEDKDGSYYISDYRNVYINPAELNTFGNKFFVEWGGTGTNLGSASLDQDSTPKAQGGVFHEMSNGLKLGVILGDETDVAALTRMLASNGAANALGFMQTADNVVDLFLAGKGSVNWGANLLYTSSKKETTGARYDQHAYALRAGASQGAWNASMLLALGAKAEAPDNANASTYKGKFGFRLGGGYDVSAQNKAFASYESYSWTQDNAATSERDGSFNKAIVGIGHTKKITESSTLFAKLQGDLTNIKLATSAGNTAEAKITRMSVPVTFGFEHSATEWLTVRGSVVENLYGTVKDEGLTTNFGTVNLGTISSGAATAGEFLRYLASARYGSSTTGNGGKKTLANSTTVNAGMTLKFGKIEIDGNIGATGSNRGTGDVASNTNAGVLSLDNLESRVGLTYNF